MSVSATIPAPRHAPRATLSALVALSALAAAGCGLSGGRLTALEENDTFDLGKGLGTDRDYTQGAVLAATMTDADTPGWARAAARAVPLFAKDSPVHLGALVGQEIYTPANLARTRPIPDDRPYAAWLYAGLALQCPVLDGDPERRRDRVDDLETDLGVLGHSAYGETTQNAVHRAYGVQEAEGWSHQVGSEVGVLVSWETRWRVAAGRIGGDWGWDLLPRARVRVGNVRTDAGLGAEARVGWNLPRDFGLMPVDSYGLSKGFHAPRPWAAVHARFEGRAVAHDVFLGGDVYADSPSVTPEPFPYGSAAGLALGYGAFSATFEQHWLSPEFRERSRHHRYGTLVVSWAWYF